MIQRTPSGPPPTNTTALLPSYLNHIPSISHTRDGRTIDSITYRKAFPPHSSIRSTPQTNSNRRRSTPRIIAAASPTTSEEEMGKASTPPPSSSIMLRSGKRRRLRGPGGRLLLLLSIGMGAACGFLTPSMRSRLGKGCETRRTVGLARFKLLHYCPRLDPASTALTQSTSAGGRPLPPPLHGDWGQQQQGEQRVCRRPSSSLVGGEMTRKYLVRRLCSRMGWDC